MIHILEKGEKADPLWGIGTEIITDDMIEALQQGKRLYLSVNDEYAVVIKKDGKRKTDKSEATDSDTISRQAAIDAIKNVDVVVLYHDGEPIDEAIEEAIEAVKRSVMASVENLQSAQHTSNNDCNGCKFVGCYDTDFPCANCIRKNKDYYAPERRTDERPDQT